MRHYKKRSIEGYIDGVISIYEGAAQNISSFGAVKNAMSRKDLELIVKLRYNSKSKRDSDLDFAESHGRTLSMKVVTMMCKSVKAMQHAIIGDMLYTIYNVDFDNDEKEMYLYLEEVRKL